MIRIRLNQNTVISPPPLSGALNLAGICCPMYWQTLIFNWKPRIWPDTQMMHKCRPSASDALGVYKAPKPVQIYQICTLDLNLFFKK